MATIRPDPPAVRNRTGRASESVSVGHPVGRDVKENRDLWNSWSDDFQAAWNADTGADEPPPALVHYGPGFPADERLDFLPDLDGADARFVVADVTDLPLADDAFDLAFSSWVLQMVPDLDACFAEAARVLRTGGTLVFAVPHPFYEQYDPETRELTRSYFDDAPERKSIGDLEADLVVFHRGVGEIHRSLTDAGFVVERVFEPGSDDPADYEAHWSHKPELMAMVPPTLVVKAVVE